MLQEINMSIMRYGDVPTIRVGWNHVANYKDGSFWPFATNKVWKMAININMGHFTKSNHKGGYIFIFFIGTTPSVLQPNNPSPGKHVRTRVFEQRSTGSLYRNLLCRASSTSYLFATKKTRCTFDYHVLLNMKWIWSKLLTENRGQISRQNITIIVIITNKSNLSFSSHFHFDIF